MTNLRDLLTDFIKEYDEEKEEVERTSLDDEMSDAIEELQVRLIDEYLETIKERFVG